MLETFLEKESHPNLKPKTYLQEDLRIPSPGSHSYKKKKKKRTLETFLEKQTQTPKPQTRNPLASSIPRVSGSPKEPILQKRKRKER